MIRGLEELGLRVWPPAERLDDDGWVLAASGGGTRRTHAVHPLDPGRDPLARKVERARTHYTGRRAPVIFKLTEVSQPAGLDPFLADRGFRREGETRVLLREPLSADRAPRDAGVALDPDPDPAWLDTCALGSGLSAAARGPLEQVLARLPEPRAFASSRRGGEVGAVALGVCADATLFLADVTTRPDRRRRGLARRCVEALLAWGARRGARRAFLQVVVGNAPAEALYAAQGFGEAYRYWYRVESARS